MLFLFFNIIGGMFELELEDNKVMGLLEATSLLEKAFTTPLEPDLNVVIDK